jgi:putative acetyltransferase
MATSILRTDSAHPDFVQLVLQLDAYLAVIDGKENDFYKQYNTISRLKHVVLLYEDGVACACGAFKQMDDSSVEIKRMYTAEACRGKGFASIVLKELEAWAKELGYGYCRLETGRRMPDAVHFYQKHAYTLIPNYGPYIGIANSICFEKPLH